ncbi:MAG: hypothetical protein HN919_02445 [Verrucomicrobia bacterium]|nr:hypothetical protein [Verrucomicrobiota bacterium]
MLTQALGLGRIIGQLYAYLYFCPSPRRLSDMEEALAVSKGSASTAARQLEQWHAVRKVWVKGDRRDYYEANDWLGGIVRNILTDTLGGRLSAYARTLDDVAENIMTTDGNGEGEFMRSRVAHLQDFSLRMRKMRNNPLIRKLLK